MHQEIMLLPSDVIAWLESNRHAGYSASLASNVNAVRQHLSTLAIPEKSELGEFYIGYGPFSVRGWYTLNEVEDVARATEVANREFGVPSKYIALTSFEGDGVTLYDRESGSVFDVTRGQFEALVSGALPPIADSFGEFLRWCKNQQHEA